MTPLMAALHHEIDFENATVSAYRRADASGNNGYWILTDTGVQYKVATKNNVAPGNVHPPVVTAEKAHGGRKGVFMQIDPWPNHTTPGEKSLIDVCNSDIDPTAPYFGDTRTVSFAVMLPEDFEPNTSELMLCEWWRNSADVTLVLVPGTTRWQLGIIDHAGQLHRHAGATLTPGQWHTLVLQVTPNYQGNGQARVWQDGETILNVTDTTVGLAPAGSTRKYAIDVGLYRPACSKTAKAYFDDIRYGDTYGDVSGGGVPAAPERPAGIDLARGCPATASSVESETLYMAEGAVDGDDHTRWSSDKISNPQWICMDLGASRTFNQVRLVWSGCRNQPYQIETSEDARIWTPLYSTPNGAGGMNDLTGLAGSGRHVRLNGTTRAAAYRYSLLAFEVYNGLGVTTGRSWAKLEWAAAPRARSYHVKRAPVAGGPYETIASNLSETTFTDEGLAGGRTYYYVVSAVNAGGESGNSVETPVTLAPADPPVITNFKPNAIIPDAELVFRKKNAFPLRGAFFYGLMQLLK
jgi:hypothetical protein